MTTGLRSGRWERTFRLHRCRGFDLPRLAGVRRRTPTAPRRGATRRSRESKPGRRLLPNGTSTPPTADQSFGSRPLAGRSHDLMAHTGLGGVMRTAVIICAVGAVLALTPGPATASTLKPVLRISATSAPVGEDIPYTITVTPAAKAQGKRVRIQVRGYAAWVGFDTFRVPKSGKITDDVEGYQPGLGRYRVLVLGETGRGDRQVAGGQRELDAEGSLARGPPLRPVASTIPNTHEDPSGTSHLDGLPVFDDLRLLLRLARGNLHRGDARLVVLGLHPQRPLSRS